MYKAFLVGDESTYVVRSPGGRIMEAYKINYAIPGSKDNAKAAAEAHAARLNPVIKKAA